MVAPAERRMLARRHLDAWVIAATKGLADESYSRVREEIADHFHEALEAGVGSGLSADEAARRAIEALGPARKARRVFRRTYLTTSQANLVRSIAALPRPRGSFGTSWVSRHSRALAGFGVTLITLLVVVVNPGEAAPSTVGLVCVVAMAVSATTLAIVPRVFRQGRERAAVALGAAAEVAVWGGYLIVMGRGDAFHTWLLATFLVVSVLTVVPVLAKLPRRVGTD